MNFQEAAELTRAYFHGPAPKYDSIKCADTLSVPALPRPPKLRAYDAEGRYDERRVDSFRVVVDGTLSLSYEEASEILPPELWAEAKQLALDQLWQSDKDQTERVADYYRLRNDNARSRYM